MRDALVDFTPADPGTRSAFLTYEPYYGLKEKAFSLSADPRFLYKSRAHAPMFDELRAGIRRREGIIVLTGEPGTGKTTLCRGVLAALDRKTFCAFVPDPFVSREDLLKMLLIEFGVLSVEDVKSGRMQAATRLELSYPLYDFLRSLVPLQAYAVLIIDEAQNLSSTAARGDPHPLRSRGTGKTSAARARRPARASRQAQGSRDEAGRSAHFRPLLARAARAGCPACIHRASPDSCGRRRRSRGIHARGARSCLQRVERKPSPPQPYRRQVAAPRASRQDVDHHAGDRDRCARRSRLRQRLRRRTVHGAGARRSSFPRSLFRSRRFRR